jgi:hypothetical protein
MKKVLTAIAFAVCLASFGRVAHAQLPVDDSTAETEDGIIETTVGTISTTQKDMLGMLTTAEDVNTALPVLNESTLQQPMPASTEIPSQLATTTPQPGDATTISNNNGTSSISGTDYWAGLLKEQEAVGADLQAMAVESIASQQQRAEESEDEETLVSGASSLEEIAADGDRFEEEQENTEAQAAQAANLAALTEAQSQINEANEDAAERVDHQNTAQLFAVEAAALIGAAAP